MQSVRGRIVLALGGVLLSLGCFAPVASADDVSKPLIGSWKLTDWVLQVVGEGNREPFGPKPKGRLVVTPEGHWIVIITGADRRPAKTNDEKLALFDSMLAYSGVYTVEGDRITIKVEMSSNEVFTGANQIQTRFFTLEGDKLTVRTPEITSAALPGKNIVGTNIFIREH
jgi:lipocalin-like protein